MPTPTELVSDVMEELGVLGLNETPSAADAALIKKRYTRKHSDLEQRDIAYWPADVIPNEVMEGLTMVMADICAPAFGRLRDPAREQMGMAKLYELTSIETAGEETQADYY